MKKILMLQTGPNTINSKYAQWLLSIGVSPSIAPYMPGRTQAQHRKQAEALLNGVDCLLLPGGIDIHPFFYTEDIVNALNCDYEFDMWQQTFLQTAADLGVKVFGICRGAQFINVFLGGKLTQHIDTKDHHYHNQKVPGLSRGALSHEVIQCAPSSFIKGRDNIILCNSLHHQGIIPPKRGVDVIFKANDNIVEVIEAEDMLGMQFHPEEITEPEAAGFWNNYFLSFLK